MFYNIELKIYQIVARCDSLLQTVEPIHWRKIVEDLLFLPLDHFFPGPCNIFILLTDFNYSDISWILCYILGKGKSSEDINRCDMDMNSLAPNTISENDSNIEHNRYVLIDLLMVVSFEEVNFSGMNFAKCLNHGG